MVGAAAHPLSPPRGLASDAGLALLVVLLLTISPLALIGLGWQYGEAGGGALEKFHPATFVALGLLLAAACLRGNPLRAVSSALNQDPAILVYLAGVGVLMLHAALVVHLPVTVFVDTFVLPVMMLTLFRDLDEGRRRALARLVHLLFAANAILALAEFALGFRLTPLTVEGETLDAEWRSSALLGHPLANALLTGSYLILVAAGGGRDLPVLLRPVAVLLAAAAMVVFGGRAATAFLIVALAVLALGRLGSVLRGARLDTRSVLAALVILPLLALAVAGLYEAGFFGQFIGRLTDDEGSAGTRIEMFELFRHLNWHDLLFGPDPRFISTLMTMYGLDYGIESFWIAMILNHGLVVSLAFFAALILFSVEAGRGTGTGGALAVVYFFAVASTSLSLSAKSPIFAIFVLLLMLLGHRARVVAVRPRIFYGSPVRLVRPIPDETFVRVRRLMP